MSDVVLDASVAVPALVDCTPAARALAHRLAEQTCHVPHLIDADVGSVLRRRVAAGALTATTARSALRALRTLADERYPHGPLATTAWRLRDNLTYYDALYVALAARLRLPLVTADARLAHAPGLPCDVELVSQRDSG